MAWMMSRGTWGKYLPTPGIHGSPRRAPLFTCRVTWRQVPYRARRSTQYYVRPRQQKKYMLGKVNTTSNNIAGRKTCPPTPHPLLAAQSRPYKFPNLKVRLFRHRRHHHRHRIHPANECAKGNLPIPHAKYASPIPPNQIAKTGKKHKDTFKKEKEKNGENNGEIHKRPAENKRS